MGKAKSKLDDEEILYCRTCQEPYPASMMVPNEHDEPFCPNCSEQYEAYADELYESRREDHEQA